MIDYLLDEHIKALLRVLLLRRDENLIVRRIGEPGAPNFGTPDPEILIWCEENDFVLVTNNRKSMPKHLADHLA